MYPCLECWSSGLTSVLFLFVRLMGMLRTLQFLVDMTIYQQQFLLHFWLLPMLVLDMLLLRKFCCFVSTRLPLTFIRPTNADAHTFGLLLITQETLSQLVNYNAIMLGWCPFLMLFTIQWPCLIECENVWILIITTQIFLYVTKIPQPFYPHLMSWIFPELAASDPK